MCSQDINIENTNESIRSEAKLLYNNWKRILNIDNKVDNEKSHVIDVKKIWNQLNSEESNSNSTKV